MEEKLGFAAKLKKYVWAGLLILFAAIHLSAWNYPFPTKVEAWLWRADSITLFDGLEIRKKHESSDGDSNESNDNSDEEADYGRWEIVFTIVPGVTYYTARVLLVVLALASLRGAPQGIYDKASWTAY